MSNLNLLKSLALGLLVSLQASVAFAQQTLTEEDIINSLQNNAAPSTMSTDEIINSLQNSFRVDGADTSIKVPTQTTTKLIESLPSMDFEIFFDYDSATIKPQSIPTIMTIGKALSGNKLAGNQFIVAGHTDAAGSSTYNARLSQKRANAVRNLLVGALSIEPNRVIAFGFGEEQLKNSVDPLAAVNRRVQIINVGR